MRRVLLVDDEPVVLRVLRVALEQAGYEVETATNGQLALESIRSGPPDAIITDIEMPVMSGQELCQHLHHEFPQRRFPIFVATSLTSLEHRNWSQSMSCITFLEKPISARKLVAALRDYFANSRAADVEPSEA